MYKKKPKRVVRVETYKGLNIYLPEEDNECDSPPGEPKVSSMSKTNNKPKTSTVGKMELD